MRVIFDAKVLLSFLIASADSSGVIRSIVLASFDAKFQLVVPHDVLAEMIQVVREKSYFRDRILEEELEQFLDDLLVVGEATPRIEWELIPVTRDRNDDYLLTAAYLAEVNVLVSGDKDLLALADQVEDLEILSPRQFLERLNPQS